MNCCDESLPTLCISLISCVCTRCSNPPRDIPSELQEIRCGTQPCQAIYVVTLPNTASHARSPRKQSICKYRYSRRRGVASLPSSLRVYMYYWQTPPTPLRIPGPIKVNLDLGCRIECRIPCLDAHMVVIDFCSPRPSANQPRRPVAHPATTSQFACCMLRRSCCTFTLNNPIPAHPWVPCFSPFLFEVPRPPLLVRNGKEAL
ncbi:hypothetical protein LZ30DRAFT_717123, partial [Colletotrichum cereale]